MTAKSGAHNVVPFCTFY